MRKIIGIRQLAKMIGARHFLKRIILLLFSGRIQFGLFAGMKYITRNVCSGWLPKIIGSYEFQIQNILAQALRILPLNPLVFDIGAAEGFYSVGLATKGAKIISWELTSEGVALQKELALLNDVTAFMDIRNECNLDNLLEVLCKDIPNIVIMDVEGYEIELITSAVLDLLSRTIIIIELHGQEAITSVVSSFDKLRYPYNIIYPSSTDCWEHLAWLPKPFRRFLLDEGRGSECPYLIYSGGYNLNVNSAN